MDSLTFLGGSKLTPARGRGRGTARASRRFVPLDGRGADGGRGVENPVISHIVLFCTGVSHTILDGA